MAESSSAKVPIIVAAIGVIGTISAATIANWDKIFADRPAESKTEEPVGDRSGARPETSAAAIAATAPDISGNWHDNEGYSYIIEQSGENFRFAEYRAGKQVGTGEGMVQGRSLTQTFQSEGMKGSCTGVLAADGRSMSGVCSSGDETFPLYAVR